MSQYQEEWGESLLSLQKYFPYYLVFWALLHAAINILASNLRFVKTKYKFFR